MADTSLSSAAFSSENGAWIEEQERLYQKDPTLLDPSWCAFFERQPSRKEEKREELGTLNALDALNAIDAKVERLVHAYRTYGHLAAQCDPMQPKPSPPLFLQRAYFGLESADFDTALVNACGFFESPRVPLSRLLQRLEQLYCGVTGFEYMGLCPPDVQRFIEQELESPRDHAPYSLEDKRNILHQLNRSELFERFLHRHYTGQKRFSLEGGETLIPMLHELIEEASLLGYSEFILGMAHRGRLNVLANVLEKSYREIFAEFEEHLPKDPSEGSGDVKYHQGFSVERATENGRSVKIILCPNPSHLESVYPVVEGSAYARCVQLGGTVEATKRVLPIVLHGDGALAGQGVVYETLQMAHLKGYNTGGTLHFVINNQIGFTTPPSQGRSTLYCTDIARCFRIPVFHLNAEHPEECLFAMHLALLVRHHFGCDVFLDLNCYRKFGHNETDEPAFTQPHQAKWIRERPSIRDLYRKQLHTEGLDTALSESSEKKCEEALESAFKLRKEPLESTSSAEQHPSSSQPSVDTSVPQERLLALTEACCRVPDSFHIHPKIQHLCEMRLQMAKGEIPCDWGMAELLSMAVILTDGNDVRLSGQDSARGTFSHRHALWVDQENEQKYYPLEVVAKQQGRFDVLNSPLSEYAALAFEFGYSVAYPEACVFWEAQFGDFANGAQIIIDQYIAAAEQKWGLPFDLILLLPHGYEGQGPEHSSARLERFLALCGNDNLYVTYPTTPCQLFHLFRRQQKASFHKPLVVMTPKGLLRHPDCVSTIQEIAEGSFQEVLAEEFVEGIKTLVLCSGRFYYDLLAERAKRQEKGDKKGDDNKMAILRVEQLYPLPKLLASIVHRYTEVTRYVWAQEEPQNMGAWTYIESPLREIVSGSQWEYIGRPRSASPAVGSYARHKLEHQQLMERLFR